MADYNIDRSNRPYSTTLQGIRDISGAIIGIQGEKKEKKEAERVGEIRQQIADAFTSSDHARLSELRIQNPEIVKSMDFDEMYGFKNDATKQNAIESSIRMKSARSILDKKRVMADRITFLQSQGADFTRSLEIYQDLQKGDETSADGEAEMLSKIYSQNKDSKSAPMSAPTDADDYVADMEAQYSIDNPGKKLPPGKRADYRLAYKRIQSNELRENLRTKYGAEASDKMIDSLAGVSEKKNYMNETIRLLDAGAKTGAVQERLFTFKAASKELENIQAKLGLNVIQNTTFGSLSETELKFALASALPTGLNEPELRVWAERKVKALGKLEDYITDAAIYLDEGGSRTGWLRMQRHEERKRKAQDGSLDKDARIKELKAKLGIK